MTSTVAALRRSQVEHFAEQLGIDADQLERATWAVWSNINPQTKPFEFALSIAGVALRAAQEV